MSEDSPKNVSYAIVNLVRKKISSEYVTASDSDVAKALDLSRGAIYSYKIGRDVMSPLTLDRAQAILELPPDELSDYSLMLSMEASPEAKRVWAAQRWMLDQAKKYGASVLFAAVIASGSGALPGQQVGEATVEGGPLQYILWQIGRRLSRLFRGLKPRAATPLHLTAWIRARNRSTGSRPSIWLPTPVST